MSGKVKNKKNDEMIPRFAPGAKVILAPDGVDRIHDNDLKPENIKARVTTYIDFDIVLELRKRAKKKKTKYQTLLNELLRGAVFPKEKDAPITELRLRKILREELKK